MQRPRVSRIPIRDFAYLSSRPFVLRLIFGGLESVAHQKSKEAASLETASLQFVYRIVVYFSLANNALKFTCEAIIPFRSAMATRSCNMVSRWRMVTVASSSVWWSTVAQNGVPMAS